uniref:Secreted protein n=1 Tax=Steinernema glaseri TaxID=37863 RepID=A0A1I7ZY85_9BILA
MSSCKVLCCAIIFSCALYHVFGAVPAASYYWTTRKLECVNSGLNISRCALRKPGKQAELNPGCFEELGKRNETRVYCRLNCEESDETTVLAKRPSWNHECSSFFTYHLERRRRDWYLWRSGNCLSTTITFEIRCGFPRDPRVFYRENQHLFEYEDAQ